MIRGISVLALAALLTALPGCFLFGGGDDKKEKKQGEALMDSSTGADPASALMPGATPGIPEERSPSQALPIAALVMSGITLLSLIVHTRRHRRRAESDSW